MKPPFDIAADLDTPVSAYLKLAPFRPRFLLESVEGGERLARYSFIGFGDCLEVRLDASGLSRRRRALAAAAHQGRILERAARGAGARAAAPAGDSRACRCRAAWSATRPTMPCATSSACRGAVSMTPSRRMRIMSHRARCWYSIISRAAPRCCTTAAKRSGKPCAAKSCGRCAARCRRSSPPEAFSPATPSLSESAHARGVRRAQEYIASGDVYQLVLASRFEGRHALAPFEVYRALRLLNPSPYMFFCELGDITVVGSSPEALVKSHGGHAQLRPIAGSRPRGADAARDAALEVGIAGRSEGEFRARHAGRFGAQRFGPGGRPPDPSWSSRTA